MTRNAGKGGETIRTADKVAEPLDSGMGGGNGEKFTIKARKNAIHTSCKEFSVFTKKI
jgi:hypothetical protein